MKYWKRMKKSTKIGLAGSLAYAATSLTLPALASSFEKPVFQPVDVYNIKTVEQADGAYAEWVKLSAEDKIVSYEEVKNLDNIIERKIVLFQYQQQRLDSEISLLGNTYEMDDKIREVENSIGELDSKKIYVSPEFEQIKGDFNRKVMRFFPFLIEKPMFYSAYQPVEEQLSKAMKELVLKSDEFLKTYYNDDSLKVLSGKENYVVKDVIAFYNILYEERSEILFDTGIKEEKQKLKEKLKILEKEKGQLERSNDLKIKGVRKKIDALESKIDEVMKERAPFEKYLTAKKSIDDYIEKWADYNNYTGFSMALMYEDQGKDVPLARADLKHNRKIFELNNKRATEGLQDCFKNLGYDVGIEGLKNPAKTMFPWPWWLNTLFGMFFPVFRNVIAASFIRREADAFDYWEGILIEPFFFTLFFDGAFPLMGAIRLFGMLLMLEPLRKATGARTLK